MQTELTAMRLQRIHSPRIDGGTVLMIVVLAAVVVVGIFGLIHQ